MSNQSNKNSESGPDPVILCIFVTVLGIGRWWIKNEHKLMKWYFNHYEQIYYVLWGLVLALIALVMMIIIKKTKDIQERGRLLSPHWDQKDNNILVGITQDEIDLHLSDDLRCTHVQIIGTTGRGKTQSIVIPWTLRDLYRGKSVVLIDGKGSMDIPIKLRDAIHHYGMKVKVSEFDLDKPQLSVQINPLKQGTPQQITDRLFSAFEFEDPFYRSVQYDICGYLTRLIQETGEVVTFKFLYELLVDERKLADKIKLLPEGHDLRKGLLEFLKISPTDRKKNLAGLTSQLSPFAIGELSTFVNGGTGEVIMGNVLNSSNETQLFIMSIPTLKYQKIGHQLGKLVLQDLAFCVGNREKREKKKFASVFLDEFSEFAYEGFVSILNKARSAKVALHLSHQSMSDLSKVSPDFAKSVITNTNIKCILGLNDPDTADFFARHLGTRTEEKLTEQVDDEGFMKGHRSTGRGSLREVESYKVHPNKLKELTNGKGVLHVPTSRGNVTEVIQFQSIGGQH